MKSDIKVTEFKSPTASEELQDYLNGKNSWECPIMEHDIIELKYAMIGKKADVSTRILLLHRTPLPKITG